MMTRLFMGLIALSPLVITGCQQPAAEFDQLAQNEAEDIFGQNPNDLIGEQNNDQPNAAGVADDKDFNSTKARSKIVRVLLNVLERLDNDEGSEEERRLVRGILEEADEELANSLGDASLHKIVAANQRKRAFYIPHRTRSKQISPIVREAEPEQPHGLDQKNDILDNPQPQQPAPTTPTKDATPAGDATLPETGN
ncbi:MAG: hypothetical protein ACI9HK_004551 [Pirellulaceae bacterium]|jgi:hypothetical protein